MNNESQKKSILAVDVGFGNTKAVWRKNNSKPKSWDEICFRSVTPRVVVDAGLSLQSMDRVIINVGSERFYVGPKATLEGGARELHPDYINTTTHESLLCGAWHYMCQREKHVAKSIDLLVLGLPVANYKTDRRRLMELGGKVHNIPVPVELRPRYGKEYEDVMAKSVLVLPQPFGSLCLASEISHDFDLFDDGSISLVVDIGYNTIDWLVAESMTPQLELCGSFNGGFSKILKAVSQKISFDHGVGGQNFGQIERGMISGVMNVDLKKVDMTEYKDTASEVASAAISDLLQQFDPQRFGVNQIFLTGGGAAAYKDALQARLPNNTITCLENGVMANARGFYQAGLDYFND